MLQDGNGYRMGHEDDLEFPIYKYSANLLSIMLHASLYACHIVCVCDMITKNRLCIYIFADIYIYASM